MDSIPHYAVRAKALRLAANDSMITLATRLSIPAAAIFHMERGDAGHLQTAQTAVGHYTGRANEKPLQTEVGRRIRDLRHRAGHTATQLAGLTGVKPNLMWSIESKPHMSRKTCRKIAAFYGVPAAELEAA